MVFFQVWLYYICINSFAFHCTGVSCAVLPCDELNHGRGSCVIYNALYLGWSFVICVCIALIDLEKAQLFSDLTSNGNSVLFAGPLLFLYI